MLEAASQHHHVHVHEQMSHVTQLLYVFVCSLPVAATNKGATQLILDIERESPTDVSACFSESMCQPLYLVYV